MEKEAIRERLGEIIQTARIQKDMSLEQVAEMSAIKPNTLLRIEQGKFLPSFEVICDICSALDLSIQIGKENLF